MRKLALLLIFMLAITPVFAQEETLIDEEFISGGFGGPELRVGPVLGTTGVFVGGRGGWLINHTFVIGGGGYGLVNDVKVNNVMFGNEQAYLNFGYGGLHLEYIGNPNKLIHYSIQALVGGGGVEYRRRMGGSEGDMSDGVFVLEPGLSAELNVSPFFRIGAGVSYRYVSGVQTLGLTDKDLSGANGFLTLKFGTF